MINDVALLAVKINVFDRLKYGHGGQHLLELYIKKATPKDGSH